MLEIKNLTLRKNSHPILQEINVTFRQGEIHSLLGRNGTGKSTMAYAILGLAEYRLSSGKIVWNGKDMTKKSVSERAKSGITLAWQEPARFEGLTVREYLGISKRANKNSLPIEECLQRVGLEPENYLDRQVDETLSGGERKRIELAAVLAMQPKLAILDEPDSGIDALSIDFIKQVIRTLVQQGSTILLITHQEEVAEMADRTSVLCGGQLLKTGSPEEIARFFRNHCQPCVHVNKPQEEVIDNG